MISPLLRVRRYVYRSNTITQYLCRWPTADHYGSAEIIFVSPAVLPLQDL